VDERFKHTGLVKNEKDLLENNWKDLASI